MIVEKQIPVSSQTDFRIASMTKSFVSVAILQLRDAGKLRLDDPAYLYIPELKDQRGAGFGCAGYHDPKSADAFGRIPGRQSLG